MKSFPDRPAYRHMGEHDQSVLNLYDDADDVFAAQEIGNDYQFVNMRHQHTVLGMDQLDLIAPLFLEHMIDPPDYVEIAIRGGNHLNDPRALNGSLWISTRHELYSNIYTLILNKRRRVVAKSLKDVYQLSGKMPPRGTAHLPNQITEGSTLRNTIIDSYEFAALRGMMRCLHNET